MNERGFNVLPNVRAVKEPKEASEWIDPKSRVEEEKFRKLSADLERRRIRRYNQHVEEQEKVKKELGDLQRDRLRFEREKVLRRRNTISTGPEIRQYAQTSPQSSDSKRPEQNAFSGGSASIAFDPSTLKYGSRHGRRTKTAPVGCSTGKTVGNERLQQEETTILDAEAPGEYSQSPNGNKSWGAAWLDAKKEQNTRGEIKYRWTSLMLKAEKDKMKVLSEKWTALKESKLASIKNVLNKKHSDISEPYNDGDSGSVKEVKFVENEIGSSRIWCENKEVPLPSPEVRLVKHSRSAGNQRVNSDKHRKRETDEEEIKMPSIVCKELDANSESSQLNDQGILKRQRRRNVPAIGKDREAKREDELKEERNKAPLPVVGNFLPQLQGTIEH